jgi:hypothetical protein
MAFFFSPPGKNNMRYTCPKCHSSTIERKDHARQLCASAGLAVGAASGATTAIGGAKFGIIVGAFAGPFGAATGSILGAILATIVGGTAGTIGGSKLGCAIDDNILYNYKCLSCHHDFMYRFKN